MKKIVFLIFLTLFISFFCSCIIGIAKANPTELSSKEINSVIQYVCESNLKISQEIKDYSEPQVNEFISNSIKELSSLSLNGKITNEEFEIADSELDHLRGKNGKEVSAILNKLVNKTQVLLSSDSFIFRILLATIGTGAIMVGIAEMKSAIGGLTGKGLGLIPFCIGFILWGNALFHE